MRAADEAVVMMVKEISDLEKDLSRKIGRVFSTSIRGVLSKNQKE